MSKVTYNELLSLARNMQDQSTLTARRTATKKLWDKLSNPQTRTRIATEAPSFQALQAFWDLIVSSTILSAQKIDQKTKQGLSQDDLAMAFGLLSLAGDSRHAEEVYTIAAKRPAMPPQFGKLYRDPFLLSSKHARMALNFCLELLDDERACDKAESQILRMVAGMVSQTGYVSSFRSESEIQVILEEMEKRIIIVSASGENDGRDDRIPHAVQVSAAEIFRNLMRTATVELAMDLPVLVASSIKMVAVWCSKAVSEAADNDMRLSTQNVFLPLLDGISCLLHRNPEQACEPLKRHGRVILKFAKKTYRSSPQQDRYYGEILHDYFLAHLLIAQVAGQLQGKMSGDVGDLGDASLSLRWMEDTIDMLIRRYSDVSDETGLVETAEIRIEGESSSTSSPRTKHLQLIAHLLNCAQRSYLCEAELNTEALSTILGKVIEAGLTTRPQHVVNQNDRNVESLPEVEPSVIVQSPFWKNILLPLIASTSLPNNLLEAANDESSNNRHGCMLAAAAGAVREAKPPTAASVRQLLQLVSVCASMYPAGACWMSSSLSCWYDLPEITGNQEDVFSNDAHVIIPPRHVQGSYPEDLAVILNVLGSILVSQGDMNGDTNVQLFAVRALEHLSLSTSSIALLSPGGSKYQIESAWRGIWSTLFRRDLRYQLSTRDCSRGSQGEAVSSLIASIAQNRCVDLMVRWSDDVQARHETFLRKHQGDVWNLPLFATSAEVNGRAASRITSFLVHAVGLTEGEDSILEYRYENPQNFVNTVGRRGRLVNYFLATIAGRDREAYSVASDCLALLAHGSIQSLPSAPIVGGQIMHERKVRIRSVSANSSGKWKDLPLTNSKERFAFPSALASNLVRASLAQLDGKQTSADLLGDMASRELSGALGVVFNNKSSPTPEGLDQLRGHSLEESLYSLVVYISFLMSSPANVVRERYDDVCSEAATLSKQIRAGLVTTTPPSTNSLNWFKDVSKGLIKLGAEYDLALPQSLVSEGSRLYSELIGVLDGYAQNNLAESKSSPSGAALNFDSDEDSVGDHKSWKASKRPRQSIDLQSSPKRRRSPTLLEPMDVCICADLAMALRPTPPTLKGVVEALTGVAIDHHWALGDSEACDPAAAIYVSWLLCNHATKRSNNDQLESLVSLSLQILKTAKRSGVAKSDTISYCFRAALKILRQRIASDEVNTLNAEECVDFLALWTEADPAERKKLNFCSFTRQESIRIASKFFLVGGPTLRFHWGKDFPNLVLPGLCDPSGCVRRQSAISVSQCLTSTPNEPAVIDSTLRNIFFLSDGRLAFKKWYTSFSPKLDVAGKQMWEDLMPSVLSCSLLCMALISGQTSLAVEQTKIGFHFIEIASLHPEHEASSFSLLECMAVGAGYGCIEHLMVECCNDLLWLWCTRDNRDPMIDSLPLLLTSPKTLRFALKASLHRIYDEAGMQRLRAEAASDFAVRSQSLLPILLANAASPIETDGNIRDFLTLYDDNAQTENIYQQFVPGICALAMCWNWGSKEDQARASDLTARMNGFIPKEKVDVAIERFLPVIIFEVLGKVGSPFFGSGARVSDIVEAIIDFTKTFGDVESRDPFYNVGVSLPELFLFASNRMIRLRKTCRASNCLSLFQVFSSILAASLGPNDMRNPPVSFFLFTVSEILTQGLTGNIVSGIFAATKEVLVCLRQRLDAEKNGSFWEVVEQDLTILEISAISLHERSQKVLLEALHASYCRLRKNALKSMGFGSPVEEDGPSIDGMSGIVFSSEYEHCSRLLSQENSHGNRNSVLILEATYDFVQWISLQWPSLETRRQDFPLLNKNEASSQDLGLLHKLNECYCLQNAVPTQSGQISSKTPSVLLHEIQRLLNSMTDTSTDSETLRFSPSRALLCIQLGNLAASLSTGWMLSSKEILPTVQLLSGLCQGYPHEIKKAAVKCLGMFRRSIESMDEEPTFDIDDDKKEVHGTLSSSLLALESDCIRILVRCLRSENQGKAMVACDTLGAVLKLRHAGEFSRFLDSKTTRFLEPFFSKKGKFIKKKACIDPNRAARIKQHFGGNVTWLDWCWDESIWKKAKSISFESWVCIVVPAMLLCRHEPASKSPRDFLDHFQAMAEVDSGFATALFPLCVLRLLLESEPDNVSPDTTEGDTWIGSPEGKYNALISKCFTALLSVCIESPSGDSRAACLVLDTLDRLRVLTQVRFQNSHNHMPNDRVKKSSQTESSQGSSASTGHECSDGIAWRGVIYGVVVRIDGLLLARACARVGRHASARFYAELYADNRFGGSTKPISNVFEDSGSLVSSRCDVSGFEVGDTQSPCPMSLRRDGYRFLEILRDCSLSDHQMAEKTALEGFLSDLSLTLSSSTEGWYRISSRAPVEEIRRLTLETSSEKRTSSIVDCLANLGVPDVLQSYVAGQAFLNGTSSLQSTTSTKWFESCLEDPRLFDVDFSSGSDLSTEFEKRSAMFSSDDSCFHGMFLSGLASYAKDDMNTCSVRVEACREFVTTDLVSVANGESPWLQTSRVLDRATALQDVEFLIIAGKQRSSIFDSWVRKNEGMKCPPVPQGKSLDIEFPVSDFTREVALRSALNKASAGATGRSRALASDLRRLLWATIEVNRAFGKIDKCEGMLSRLNAIDRDAGYEETLRRSMLEADIHEVRGNKLLAVQSMRLITRWLDRVDLPPEDQDVRANGLLSLGARLSKYKAETGEVILKHYFDPGLSIAQQYRNNSDTVRSRKVLCSGLLAHSDLLMNLYQIVLTRISSPEWSKAERSLIEREKELKQCVAIISDNSKTKGKKKVVDRDLSIYRLSLSREVQNARAARQKIQDSVGEFLFGTVQSIISALSIAGTEEQGVSKYAYRLISIWFNPNSSRESNKLQQLFSSAFDNIPTYRFVPLTNQLFARLGTSGEFSDTLHSLARRMCSDHPYQCIVHLVRLLSEGSSKDKIRQERAKIAEEILSDLKQSENNAFLQPLIEGYEDLCLAYISLALLDVSQLTLDKKRRSRVASLPSTSRVDQCLGRGSRRRPCPPCVLTKPPEIRPGCNYDDVETIAGFEEAFSIAETGLTRPKILVCNGSKGGRFKQLVKGGDDCRGDSVMEQVFLYVNELFRAQRNSGVNSPMEKNKIITYNIVPLSPKTGVIEWVEDTTPFSDYISDNRSVVGPGAHSRYFPGEWGFRLCREVLDKASRGDKRKAFDKICSHHSPVFRYFFVERFGRCPQSWYTAKIKYSKSVAVSSFVGHILGIGDRHGSNILIHKKTGEVVHIDFGIVFEQGKLLNCPEKVPFRLTQNIVDGLGPTGPEGIFTSAAESTLSVLRKNTDSLLTILSAVVSDPLYKMSVSPMQARRRQRIAEAEDGLQGGNRNDDDWEDRNEVANHAIQRVREKLNGYEDGTSGEQQSIEGQVRFLVRAARDPDDLSEMYPGWAPWM